MENKLLSQLKNLDIEKIIDFVENEVKQVVANTYGSTLQGWRYKIILNEDGELFITGALSNGTMLMSEYEGTSSWLASIDSSIELWDIITIDDVDSLCDEDKENLMYHIALEYGDIEQDEDSEEKLTVYDYIDEYRPNLDSLFCELFREYYDDAINFYIDNEWEAYKRDSIIDEICISRDEKMFLLED